MGARQRWRAPHPSLQADLQWAHRSDVCEVFAFTPRPLALQAAAKIGRLAADQPISRCLIPGTSDRRRSTYLDRRLLLALLGTNVCLLPLRFLKWLFRFRPELVVHGAGV
jgi:hypothetical protein